MEVKEIFKKKQVFLLLSFLVPVNLAGVVTETTLSPSEDVTPPSSHVATWSLFQK